MADTPDYNETLEILRAAANKSDLITNKYHDVLVYDENSDIDLGDGEFTPSLSKRVKQFVTSAGGPVLSVNNESGHVKLGDIVNYDAEEFKNEINKNNIKKVQTIASLTSNPNLNTGDIVFVEEYHTNSGVGGGMFYYDSDKSNINDGGMVINGWVRQEKEIQFSFFGAKGNGEDDTVYLTKACNYLSTNGGIVNDNSGKTYNYSTNLTISAPNKYIELNGNITLNGIGSYFLINGSLVEVGSVSTQALTGSTVINSTGVSGLDKNDLIVIENKNDYSFSPHRAYYHDGEYQEVKSVNGNLINLKIGLISSYLASASNKIYKLNPVTVKINGVSFTGNGIYSLRVKYAANCIFNIKRAENTSIDPQSSTAFAIDKCLNVAVNSGNFYKKYNVGTATDYGIGVFNSQNVIIDGVSAFGGRHAISTGGDAANGAVPNRFISILNSNLSNDIESNIYCADFHGNTANSYYKSCVISGRIGLAGTDTAAIDCHIYGIGATVQPVLGYHETNSGKIEFLNCVTVVSDESTSASLLSNLSSALTAKITGKYSVILKGGKCVVNSKITQIINAIDNSGKDNNWIIDDFEISGNISGLTSLIRFTLLAGGVDPSLIEVTNPKYKVPESLTLVSRSGTTLANTAFKFFASSGSNANGNWRKMSDGTLICDFVYTENLAISVSYNGGFRTAGINWTFPIAFKSVPSISITPLGGSCFGGASTNLTSNLCQFFALAVTSQTEASRSLSLQAVGKWGIS